MNPNETVQSPRRAGASPSRPTAQEGQLPIGAAAQEQTPPSGVMPNPTAGAVAGDPAPRGHTGRRTRAFGSDQYRLSVPKREGFFRYVFNDTPGRCDKALEAGYAFVNDKDGKPMTFRVGVAPTGGALLGYVMEIPIKWHADDMAAQVRRENETEQAMRNGAKQGGNTDDANRYVADHMGGTNIRQAVR